MTIYTAGSLIVSFTLSHDDTWGGWGLDKRTAIEGSFSEWGGLGKTNRGRGRGKNFFLTAVAIAIGTRPFQFHEISVSNTSSSRIRDPG
jgi:hypothetical protein